MILFSISNNKYKKVDYDYITKQATRNTMLYCCFLPASKRDLYNASASGVDHNLYRFRITHFPVKPAFLPCINNVK